MVKILRLFLLLCVVGIVPSFAVTTRVSNVELLIDQADRIFLGTVISSEPDDGRLSGRIGIVTKFKKEEEYKGHEENEVSIRQWARVGPEKKIVPIYGLPTFRTGEKVVVFLFPKSTLGYSSPVALGQGVFRFLSAEKVSDSSPVINESMNANLLKGLKNSRTLEAAKTISADRLGSPKAFTLGQLKKLVAAYRGVQP